MGLSSYFYTKAGLPTDQAFNLTIGQFSMGLVGTISSWFLLKKIGRRPLYLYGQIALFFLMITIGGLAFKSDDKSVSWAIGSMLLIFTFIYDLTVGPRKFPLALAHPSEFYIFMRLTSAPLPSLINSLLLHRRRDLVHSSQGQDRGARP